MAQEFPKLEQDHQQFIENQKIFFTATAAAHARINLSPRETGCLRILGPNEAVYLDLTGSGNETAAHLRADGRITLMFCAFEGAPRILRIYGRGRILRRDGSEFRTLLSSHYDDQQPVGARQMVQISIECVKTSCGYGVPMFRFEHERPNLTRWAQAKGEAGIKNYWREKNVVSMDGAPTGILDP